MIVHECVASALCFDCIGKARNRIICTALITGCASNMYMNSKHCIYFAGVPLSHMCSCCISALLYGQIAAH